MTEHGSKMQRFGCASESGVEGLTRRKAWFGWPASGSLLVAILGVALGSLGARAQQNRHTDPINYDPTVRDGLNHFYNLDYEGAIVRFEKAMAAHATDPMPYALDEMAYIFRALYHQDLLDTTYYAHDSFLTNQRKVEIPADQLEKIDVLTNTVISLADAEIKSNPRDANAYFARGYAKGLHAAFITLADHSFYSAAKQGLEARNDSEQALKIDPAYADADMAVGIQQFAVASLPRFLRILVGIAGVGGNKEKGIELLKTAASQGVVTPVQAKTALSLFLRHDARYPEALSVQHGLATEYPHDYLFRLEEANLAKDEGNGPLAIATYKQVLLDAEKPGYFIDPRLQLAYFGLADTERGQNDLADAAKHYLQSAQQPNNSDWLKKRAELNAGEVLDLLRQRGQAVAEYRLAAASGGDQTQAALARKYMDTPYTGK
jgi:tetratricopeptide (TPR) repeat protein